MEWFEPGYEGIRILKHLILDTPPLMDDALSTLKAEIATKKQKLQSMSSEGIKYIKLGEVEKQREAEYLEEDSKIGGTEDKLDYKNSYPNTR